MLFAIAIDHTAIRWIENLLKEKEVVMKVLSAALLSMMVTATQALASAGGANTEGMGLLGTFFLAFGVLIILFQFIPGVTLFAGVLKGIFSSEASKSASQVVNNGRTSL
jgi:uncharacterized protein YqgC (DUF456 family)